jgi:hypothetical protein
MKRADFGTYLTIDHRGEKIRLFIPPKPPISSELAFSAEQRKKLGGALFSLGRLDGTADVSGFGKKLWNLSKLREFNASLRLESSSSLIFEHLSGLHGDGDLTTGENPEILGVWMIGFDRCLDHLNLKRSDSVDFWSSISRDFKLSTEERGASSGFLGRGGFGLNSVPPPREKIEEGLNLLNDHIFNQRLHLDPIDAVAIFVGMMSMLNPYGEATESVARTVALALLNREGLMTGSVISLSAAIDRHRHRFTEALSFLRNDGDWESWICAFAEFLSEAAEEAVAFNREITHLYLDERTSSLSLGRPAESILKVIDIVYETPVFTSNFLVAKSGLTPATVNKSLRHMEDLSIVREVTSKRRGRIFQHQGLIDLLNR